MRIKVLGYMNVSPSNVKSYLAQGWEFITHKVIFHKDGTFSHQMIKRDKK